ncbi:hypothetical protein [Photorhabdus thracensis]|uniref:hypothetical protein n=1 Tax=Photorhabdus thracensis TaxID=230089 RepID=UPI001300FED8|nr:hypothetical protein [Photorhabdus thracensis]
MPLFLLLTGWGATGCIKPEKSGETSRSYFLFGQPEFRMKKLINNVETVLQEQLVGLSSNFLNTRRLSVSSRTDSPHCHQPE